MKDYEEETEMKKLFDEKKFWELIENWSMAKTYTHQVATERNIKSFLRSEILRNRKEAREEMANKFNDKFYFHPFIDDIFKLTNELNKADGEFK